LGGFVRRLGELEPVLAGEVEEHLRGNWSGEIQT
jgi:hypothetical protein